WLVLPKLPKVRMRRETMLPLSGASGPARAWPNQPLMSCPNSLTKLRLLLSQSSLRAAATGKSVLSLVGSSNAIVTTIVAPGTTKSVSRSMVLTTVVSAKLMAPRLIAAATAHEVKNGVFIFMYSLLGIIGLRASGINQTQKYQDCFVNS